MPRVVLYVQGVCVKKRKKSGSDRRKKVLNQVANRKIHEALRKSSGLCPRCREDRRPLEGKTICEICLRRESLRSKRHHKKFKELVFNHYGWKCQCCGEDNPKFLTLDHIDNSGAMMRREKKHMSGLCFYRWITRNGFPTNLRTLCFNCNCGRQWNGGVCPHVEQGGDP